MALQLYQWSVSLVFATIMVALVIDTALAIRGQETVSKVLREHPHYLLFPLSALLVFLGYLCFHLAS